MSTLNPDFRGVDEIAVPRNLLEMTGWAEPDEAVGDAFDKEDRMRGQLEQEMPAACQRRAAREPNKEMLKKWDEFQVSKGRQPGSNDLTMLDEFVIGKDLAWLPQIIGSCVMSNTFRAVVIRMMVEIVFFSQGQEYFGTDEFGENNYSPYAAWSYGMARRRANMRGGDGLYCAPMAESMVKDGFLPCNSPLLLELLKSKNLDRSQDFPEPQSARLYRDFGNWKYLDDLAPDAKGKLDECPTITSGDELWDYLGDFKPSFVCSGEAIHKIGTHPDGFPIHARNPRDSWSHNMAFHGRFVASDGERFIRQSNKSWGPKHLYNRKLSEIDNSFRRGRLRCAAIGETSGIDSPLPTIGA